MSYVVQKNYITAQRILQGNGPETPFLSVKTNTNTIKIVLVTMKTPISSSVIKCEI